MAALKSLALPLLLIFMDVITTSLQVPSAQVRETYDITDRHNIKSPQQNTLEKSTSTYKAIAASNIPPFYKNLFLNNQTSKDFQEFLNNDNKSGKRTVKITYKKRSKPRQIKIDTGKLDFKILNKTMKNKNMYIDWSSHGNGSGLYKHLLKYEDASTEVPTYENRIGASLESMEYQHDSMTPNDIVNIVPIEISKNSHERNNNSFAEFSNSSRKDNSYSFARHFNSHSKSTEEPDVAYNNDYFQENLEDRKEPSKEPSSKMKAFENIQVNVIPSETSLYQDQSKSKTRYILRSKPCNTNLSKYENNDKEIHHTNDKIVSTEKNNIAYEVNELNEPYNVSNDPFKPDDTMTIKPSKVTTEVLDTIYTTNVIINASKYVSTENALLTDVKLKENNTGTNNSVNDSNRARKAYRTLRMLNRNKGQSKNLKNVQKSNISTENETSEDNSKYSQSLNKSAYFIKHARNIKTDNTMLENNDSDNVSPEKRRSNNSKHCNKIIANSIVPKFEKSKSNEQVSYSNEVTSDEDYEINSTSEDFEKYLRSIKHNSQLVSTTPESAYYTFDKLVNRNKNNAKTKSKSRINMYLKSDNSDLSEKHMKHVYNKSAISIKSQSNSNENTINDDVRLKKQNNVVHSLIHSPREDTAHMIPKLIHFKIDLYINSINNLNEKLPLPDYTPTDNIKTSEHIDYSKPLPCCTYQNCFTSQMLLRFNIRCQRTLC